MATEYYESDPESISSNSTDLSTLHIRCKTLRTTINTLTDTYGIVQDAYSKLVKDTFKLLNVDETHETISCEKSRLKEDEFRLRNITAVLTESLKVLRRSLEDHRDVIEKVVDDNGKLLTNERVPLGQLHLSFRMPSVPNIKNNVMKTPLNGSTEEGNDSISRRAECWNKKPSFTRKRKYSSISMFENTEENSTYLGLLPNDSATRMRKDHVHSWVNTLPDFKDNTTPQSVENAHGSLFRQRVENKKKFFAPLSLPTEKRKCVSRPGDGLLQDHRKVRGAFPIDSILDMLE